MTAELAGASLREAAAFFRKYFKKEIRAFVCDSWILNPAWMELLPESNLAAFMRELYLFPRTPYPQAGLFFVFGRSDGDFASYPADTSLRRAFHRLYNAGEPFRTGGMVRPDGRPRPLGKRDLPLPVDPGDIIGERRRGFRALLPEKAFGVRRSAALRDG